MPNYWITVAIVVVALFCLDVLGGLKSLWELKQRGVLELEFMSTWDKVYFVLFDWFIILMEEVFSRRPDR